ncbi:unnamed protein product [Owenia fusiformis]|uniref:Lipoma HMGIC fusion partner-like protein n=1 Tax=Owenia fusiformis TaxID=6347 RepID=A0A8S4NLE1_OWEFU|nr:unnamed protein product [Owenia fusiformis]
MDSSLLDHEQPHVANKDYDMPQKKTYAGLSCIGVLWSILSFMSMLASCVGYFMPYWLEGHMHNNTPVYLGTFRRCNYLSYSNNDELSVVKECGRYTTFWDIPGLYWKIVTVVVGTGAGLTILISFASMLGCCCREFISRTTTRVLGVFQFFAGLLVAGGAAIYPMGWDTREVKQACGDTAAIYHLGTCTMGWAYYTTMGGGALALICAFLSCNAARVRKYKFSDG